MKSSTENITLNIPNKNKGKFRFKERVGQSEFGKSFPAYPSWSAGSFPKLFNKKFLYFF